MHKNDEWFTVDYSNSIHTNNDFSVGYSLLMDKNNGWFSVGYSISIHTNNIFFIRLFQFDT